MRGLRESQTIKMTSNRLAYASRRHRDDVKDAWDKENNNSLASSVTYLGASRSRSIGELTLKDTCSLVQSQSRWFLRSPFTMCSFPCWFARSKRIRSSTLPLGPRTHHSCIFLCAPAYFCHSDPVGSSGWGRKGEGRRLICTPAGPKGRSG